MNKNHSRALTIKYNLYVTVHCLWRMLPHMLRHMFTEYPLLRVTILNLVPRAIRGLGPTIDPGTGCKMCKTLAHFPAWYHGKVAPGYHGIFSNMAVYSFLHSVCFSTVYAFRSRSSGERCSWCPSFSLRTLMVEAHGNSLGRFAASVNCFHGPCCSRIKRSRVTFPMLLAVFPFLFAQNISLPQQWFRRTFFRGFQLFARLTAFFSHVYPSTKLAKRSHEHYGRIVCIVCVSWSDDHFVCVQVGFLRMSRQQHNRIDQSQTMFYWTDCANHSAR